MDGRGHVGYWAASWSPRLRAAALVSLLFIAGFCAGGASWVPLPLSQKTAVASSLAVAKPRHALASANPRRSLSEADAEAHIHITSEPKKRALTDSPYYQEYKSGREIKPFEVLDVTIEANLEKMVQMVSYKKEIIMFAFNSQDIWLDFAIAMVDQLRGLGYLHFFAIAVHTCCDMLHGVRDGAFGDVPCVTFEFPGDHWKQEQGVTHLWIGRYKIANQIARMGVNILVIDLDTIIRRDVYADLKAEPLRGASMIHMEEGFANGGLFYLQNPVPNGPALWTHDEVWRRADIVMQMIRKDNFRGNTMDQALLNDAINAAGDFPNGSVYDWPSVYNEKDNGAHPFWHDEHNRGEISNRNVPGKRWYRAEYTREKVDLKWLLAPEAACGASCQTPQYAKYREYITTRRTYESMNISIPIDAPERAFPGGDAVELFVGAPLWTFGHAEDEYHNFDLSAVTHLVGVTWGFDPSDGGNAARRALMAAAGAWSRASPERRYATLAHHLVTPEDVASRATTAALIRRLFAAAHALGRVPAMFGFKCSDAPWIERREDGRLGVADKRIVKHGDLCYPNVGGRRCDHREFVYDFEIDHTSLPPRTIDSFDDAFEHNASHVVHLRHLPEAYNASAVKSETKQNCPIYFLEEWGPDTGGDFNPSRRRAR